MNNYIIHSVTNTGTSTCIIFKGDYALITAIYYKEHKQLSIYDIGTDSLPCNIYGITNIRKAILFIQSNFIFIS